MFLPQNRLVRIRLDAHYGCTICGQVIGQMEDLKLHQTTDFCPRSKTDTLGRPVSCSDIMKSVNRKMAESILAFHHKEGTMGDLRGILKEFGVDEIETDDQDVADSTTDSLTTEIEAIIAKLPYLDDSDELEWNKIMHLMSVECSSPTSEDDETPALQRN